MKPNLPARKVTIRTLRSLGFDRSKRTGKGEYHVSCSQCLALVINGTPAHEGRCPNIPKEIIWENN